LSYVKECLATKFKENCPVCYQSSSYIINRTKRQKSGIFWVDFYFVLVNRAPPDLCYRRSTMVDRHSSLNLKCPTFKHHQCSWINFQYISSELYIYYL